MEGRLHRQISESKLLAVSYIDRARLRTKVTQNSSNTSERTMGNIHANQRRQINRMAFLMARH